MPEQGSDLEMRFDTPQQRSGSPPAPPFSPITPVMNTASLEIAGQHHEVPPPDQSRPEPPAPVPFSESDNADAIALRSALSILQMQRQRSLQDLKTLERQKAAAAADPKAFVTELAAGRINTEADMGVFGGQIKIRDDSDMEDEAASKTEKASSTENEKRQAGSTFANIPRPQDIVRCPPINWAQYHVVGESLDKLHNEQKERPSATQPTGDGLNSQVGASDRAPKHVIAAPYDPWTDRLETPKKKS